MGPYRVLVRYISVTHVQAVHVWCMCSTRLPLRWCVRYMCGAGAVQTYPLHMWCMPDAMRCTANACMVHGQCMHGAGPVHTWCRSNACMLHGQCMASACMASACMVHGQCMHGAWPALACCMASACMVCGHLHAWCIDGVGKLAKCSWVGQFGNGM